MNYAGLFLLSLLFFIFLTLSSPSYFTFWISMEISVFFFLFLLTENNGGVKGTSYESVWNYYFIQVLSSLLLVFFLLFSEESFFFLTELEKVGVFVTIFINIGLFPFHGWGYHIAESISWKNLYLLSSVVNIPPLYLLSTFMEGSFEILLFLALINGTVMVIFLLKNLSLNWFFLSSSNYLMSWVVLASAQGANELTSFILAYLTQSLVVISFFLHSSSSGGTLLSLNESSSNVIQSISILALMGIPPFSIFMSNMTVALSLLSEGEAISPLFLLFLSFVASFLYLNSVVLSLLNRESFSLSHLNREEVFWFLPATLLPSFLFFI